MSAAERCASSMRHHRRLWHLWDILVEPFEPHFFLTLMQLVGISQVRSIPAVSTALDTQVIDDDEARALNQMLNDSEGFCKKLDLTASVATLRTMRSELARSRNRNSFTRHYDELGGRLRDEMQIRSFWALTTREADYCEPQSPLFGVEVASKFPSVAYEIDEAGKCLAFERSTAGAFHSIRCLEAGIRAASRCLGIPDPTRASDRSWFKMLKAIKDEMDSRWPNTSDRLSGDGRLFEETYAALAAMMNPYRNATMHLDYKYTCEEARHIFEVVNGFMRKVASRMDEDGKPIA